MWTVVNGDPVRMSRGDLLLTPGWNFHGHHNDTAEPMAWIDGLDIPFQYANETQFFEFGRDGISEAEHTTPDRSRAERLWGHPGLRPVAATASGPGTPLLAYRWEHTDRALGDQLALEAEGFDPQVKPAVLLSVANTPSALQKVFDELEGRNHELESLVVLAGDGGNVAQVSIGLSRDSMDDWDVEEATIRGQIQPLLDQMQP